VIHKVYELLVRARLGTAAHFDEVRLGMQPRVKSLQPSYTGLYPHIGVTLHRVVSPECVAAPYSFRATREQLESFSGLLPASQGQNLVLAVLFVPYLLDSGSNTICRRRLRHPGRRARNLLSLSRLSMSPLSIARSLALSSRLPNYAAAGNDVRRVS